MQMCLFEAGNQRALEADKEKCRLGPSVETFTPICRNPDHKMAQKKAVSRCAYQQLIFPDFGPKINLIDRSEGGAEWLS